MLVYGSFSEVGAGNSKGMGSRLLGGGLLFAGGGPLGLFLRLEEIVGAVSLLLTWPNVKLFFLGVLICGQLNLLATVPTFGSLKSERSQFSEIVVKGI